MNREDIIKKLKEYKFDVENYIVISGAAMVLYGFKDDTRDIDISCSERYTNKLLESYDCELEYEYSDGSKAYMIDDIINFGSNYYSNERDYIEGIPVQRVEDIIKLKKKLNREKDLKDLEAIYNHLNK